MKQPYIWDYTIRIKTKNGTYEYEKETLILKKKKEENKIKKLVKKR